MSGPFDLKLFRKLSILGVLSAALSLVFLLAPNQGRARVMCCEQCEINLGSCLSICDTSEECGENCYRIWEQCSLSCSIKC